jgi:hypothetical protein
MMMLLHQRTRKRGSLERESSVVPWVIRTVMEVRVELPKQKAEPGSFRTLALSTFLNVSVGGVSVRESV